MLILSLQLALKFSSFHRTGYTNMRQNNKELFGEDVIDMTDEVYGLDVEGELRGSYRPSGYPGVSSASPSP